MLPETFLLIYYTHQYREIKLQNYLITDLIFQEHASHIFQEFISVSVQFQDFSGL